MRTLYHMVTCPFSRSARLALGEKKLEFDPIIENIWVEREEFIDLNSAGTLPVLVEESGLVISELYPLMEYLEEAYQGTPKLFEGTAATRVEIRRLCVWMNTKFFNEVYQKLVWEKVLKRHYLKQWADSSVLREGARSLKHHLQYLAILLEERDWLAGRMLTMADLVAAAHLSCIDFIGYINWDAHPVVKNWYACLKSRPSFRPLLLDHMTGVQPPAHYADLDF